MNWEHAFSISAGWSSANTRWLVAIKLAFVLWEGMLVMFSTKRSSPAGSDLGRGGSLREGYKVVALLLKPSLGLFGLVGQRRVLLPHPGSATGHLIVPGDYRTLQHIQVHFGVDFQADFEDVRWRDMAFRSTTSKGSSNSLSCAIKR